MLKTCSRCGAEKDVELFYREKQNKTGRSSICKVCRDKVSARYIERHENYEVAKALMRNYKMTLADYEAMLLKQGGLCAICYRKCRTARRLAVDHDHKTGTNRGLLCFDCNTGIGKLQDSLLVLKSAVTYLEKHS